jgi:hypothetical protein
MVTWLLEITSSSCANSSLFFTGADGADGAVRKALRKTLENKVVFAIACNFVDALRAKKFLRALACRASFNDHFSDFRAECAVLIASFARGCALAQALRRV